MGAVEASQGLAVIQSPFTVLHELGFTEMEVATHAYLAMNAVAWSKILVYTVTASSFQEEMS